MLESQPANELTANNFKFFLELYGEVDGSHIVVNGNTIILCMKHDDQYVEIKFDEAYCWIVDPKVQLCSVQTMVGRLKTPISDRVLELDDLFTSLDVYEQQIKLGERFCEIVTKNELWQTAPELESLVEEWNTIKKRIAEPS